MREFRAWEVPMTIYDWPRPRPDEKIRLKKIFSAA
jgi:hypothetical protein